MLFLKSDTKGFCVSAANVSDHSMTKHRAHTNIINDINHQYSPYCASIGSSPLPNHYKFSCTPKSFDELEKVEFIVTGSIVDHWSATVTVTILHHCSAKGNQLAN